MAANTRIFWISPSKRPRGTEQLTLHPTQVKTGDYVYLSGKHWQVRSMTSLTGGGRLLHFDGRTPYVMRVPMLMCRPRTR